MNEKLIPELRFPDFVGKDEWTLKDVDSLFALQDGYAFSSKVFTSRAENGRQVIRITDINNQNKNSEKVFIPEEKIYEFGIDAYSVKNGDLLLSLTGAAGFNFYIWDNGDAFINQRTMKITPRDLENESLKVLLGPLIHEKINGMGTGQNNNLSKDALKAVEFPVPQPQEQQKIASCLSSLDKLLTAHNDKLDALKEHKKGLLQNLFPQEGETVPKIRFPEFEDDGEWNETTLVQVADYENGKAHEKDIDEDGNYLVVNSKFISTEGETVKYSNTAFCPASEGDILMVLSDIPNGKAIAKCFYVDEDDKYSVNQRICRITATDYDSRFLFYIMDRNAYFLSFDDGVKQTNLRKSDVLEFTFRIPTNPVEQTKIASCISAVDELIKAQTKKIEELNQHKRGLMQGLFPKIKS